MSVIHLLSSKLTAFSERWVPDPFVIAILLTFLTFGLALLFGNEISQGDPEHVILLWSQGIWRFLAFSMEMCLVLVTGHALATAPASKRWVDRLAQVASSQGSAIVITALVAMTMGLINWGLGLIIGALTAREVGLSCARRGIPVHYPLLGAAGYSGLLVWHGGLSGTAPLKVTQAVNLAELKVKQAVIPLTETTFSPLNCVLLMGVIVLVPLLLWLMAPPVDSCRAATQWVAHSGETSEHAASHADSSLAGSLDQSRWLSSAVAILILIAWYFRVNSLGVSSIDLSVINLGALGFGLLLHPSIRSYSQAATEAASSCAGVMLQFPLYAGIMGVMSGAGLTSWLTQQVSLLASSTTLAPLTFLMAGFVNLFIPSGGGQWAVQGPLVLESAAALQAPPGAAVIAFAHGDAWTNMLQPFWALPLLAITHLQARELVGYTAALMIALLPWYLFSLWAF